MRSRKEGICHAVLAESRGKGHDMGDADETYLGLAVSCGQTYDQEAY